jgi:hypothetical protein
MSSRYMKMNMSFSPTKDISIAHWKVSPAFIKPKGILSYMKLPHGVVKVVFSLSSDAFPPGYILRIHPSWRSYFLPLLSGVCNPSLAEVNFPLVIIYSDF